MGLFEAGALGTGPPLAAASPRFEELLCELRCEHQRVVQQLGEWPALDAGCTGCASPHSNPSGGLRSAAWTPTRLSPATSPKAAEAVAAAAAAVAGPTPADAGLELLEIRDLPGQVFADPCCGDGCSGDDATSVDLPVPDADPTPLRLHSEHHRPDGAAVDDVRESVGVGSVASGWFDSQSPSSPIKRAGDLRRSVTELFTVNGEIFPQSSQRGSSNKNALHDAVSSPSFELFWSIVILLSTLMMAVEAQYDGMQAAWEFNLVAAPGPADERWPGAEVVFELANWLFGILFTLELSIRFVALRSEFCTDPWGWIDIFAVVFWFVERASKAFPIPGGPRVIRITRLVKLMRFLRIIKFINAFEKLYLMVASIRSSFSALAWSAAVLLLVEVILSLLLNLFLEQYWTEEQHPFEDRQLIYEYFGTFTKALLSMFEMLLGNWYTVTRALIKVSEWCAVFGVLHQMVMGFAVIEVITGVFLHETFQVASLDDGIMTNETKRAIKSHTAKLEVFFKSADADGNGLLDEDELENVLARQKVQEWLSAMGLNVKDVAMAFSVFDANGDGMISAEELVTGALQMKGPARAIDLAVLQHSIDEVKSKLDARPTT